MKLFLLKLMSKRKYILLRLHNFAIQLLVEKNETRTKKQKKKNLPTIVEFNTKLCCLQYNNK